MFLQTIMLIGLLFQTIGLLMMQFHTKIPTRLIKNSAILGWGIFAFTGVPTTILIFITSPI